MHPYVAAGAISAVLVLAGTVLSCVGAPHEERADTTNATAEASGHGHATGAHPWAGGTGKAPTAAEAADLPSLGNVEIGSDRAFTPAAGVRSGRGTFDDPYVISGWRFESLYIHDTTAAFEIKDSYVSNILVLDWTGAGGYVHHNTIHNLRTNRNVERVGDPSATVVEKNTIHRVEELRHFDGIVRNNTIGRPALLPLLDLSDAVVLNIAGLNGAGIHHNLIHGGVDMKIHGHHHSDASGAHSHNHGRPDEEQGEDHVEDHQVRYVDFLFHNNTIVDSGFGLRYNDLAHAGDDRTATSEQEPDLEKPHVHHTRVALVDNVVQGATLRVAVLNADDERHLPGQSAELILARNRILGALAGDGLVVQDVADARVHVTGNRVERGDLQLGTSAGILLQRVRNSSIHLDGNTIQDHRYGIRASQFDLHTTWSLGANRASGAEHPVYWDESVPNPPREEGGDGHEHAHAEEGAAPAALRRLGLR